MGHQGEGYFSDEVAPSIRQPAQRTILEFGKTEVVALLEFLEEGNFERGELGVGLFAILPNLPDGLKILRDIAGDETLRSTWQRRVGPSALKLADIT